MNRNIPFIALLAAILIASACSLGSKYDSDGEAIYMTGKTLDGKPVKNSVDRSALPDPDITLSCAGCHGEDARGGKNTIPAFGPYVAPMITWKALTTGGDGVAFTEQTLAHAIREGISPEGYRLHHPMPKWDLTDDQMHSLIEYLKTK
jgi:hypothetical protein